MKKIKALLTASIMTITAVFSSALYISEPEIKAADKVNIMPIGDSITFGLGEDGGYRKYLDYTLKTKNIVFDMVGPEGRDSESFNYNGQNCQYDGNHAGYSGFTIKQQYPIPSWGENGLLERLKSKDAVKQAQPDIVLLIIGTNDMTANRNLNDCEQDLHTLIDYILGDMPESGVVFMGSIPEFTAYGGNEQRVGNYNNTVKKVAESYGDNVQFADVHGCLNGMADMSSDNLHPSGAGYEKMGKFWAEVIEKYLSDQNGTPDNTDSTEPSETSETTETTETTDDTFDPEDPEILYSDFENGLSGWQARGSVTVSQSKDEAADGTASAFVSERTAAWNGIAYTLSSKRCPAGTHIKVQAKVLQKTDSPVRFKMTMQYSNGETAVYDTFAEADAEPGQWVTISADDYVVQDASDPILYIETDTDLCDFYFDEVIVMKTDGTNPDEPVLGDVNDDSEFNSADLVLFQKWIIGDPETELANWESADFDKNDILNVFDLYIMKNKLISGNDSES